MEGSAAQRTISIFTAPSTDPMFQIPRPRTLEECSQEARPCPWVSCRHHLLLEVATADPSARDKRATSMRLNAASGRQGRRRGLQSSAAALLVRTWMDEAVEALSRMRYTCALDVARDYPDGAPTSLVAQLLGLSEQAIDAEVREAGQRWRERAEGRGLTH